VEFAFYFHLWCLGERKRDDLFVLLLLFLRFGFMLQLIVLVSLDVVDHQQTHRQTLAIVLTYFLLQLQQRTKKKCHTHTQTNAQKNTSHIIRVKVRV
jgi:hypothetical protein